MRRTHLRGSKNLLRAVVLRVEGLEARGLMSIDGFAAWSLVGPTIPSAVPLSVARLLGSAEVASNLAGSQAAGAASSAPYTPAQLRHAYGVDLLSQDGTGQTIAIVDAHSSPSIASDLAAFDSRFNLPTANFTVVTPSTQAAPTYDSGWATEISLDVEWAHAIAPGAKIVLVETGVDQRTNASADSDVSLMGGVSYAVSLGANQVSMSWGGGEFSGESSYDSTFNHPGVTFFASSGDTGGDVLWPAISPYVTSVGGTKVSLDAAGNKISETTWSSGGGGVSTMVTRPSYQVGFSSASNRAVPDVAYNADPNSGIYVLDNNQYLQVGGTSAGAPQWAGLAALANQGLLAAGKSSLGTGQAYGTNTVLYNLAGGTSYTNPNGDFLDITTGSNTHPATTGYDEATGLGSPIANVLIPDLIGPATTPPTAPTVGDSGFESVNVGSGYQYAPTGSAWSFPGDVSNSGSGVTGNGSGFTAGNPAAPQGSQVAFLQSTGTISQSVAGWSAGSYTISFQSAQRANYQSSAEDFEILVDGKVVGTFKPSGTSYQAYTTSSFAVSAGSHVIKFLGLDSAGGDNTAFLDAVSVAVATAPPAPPAFPSPGDAGFESVNVGSGYQYAPSGSAWSFPGDVSNSGSGLTGNGSGFTAGNPAAPQGSQVAFLQATGTISQSVAGWSSGSYTISFQSAQRANYQSSSEDFEILVDGKVVGTFKPSGTSYQAYTTSSFTVSAGSHVLEFLGLDSAGGDNTAFLDAVSVAIA